MCEGNQINYGKIDNGIAQITLQNSNSRVPYFTSTLTLGLEIEQSVTTLQMQQ